MNVSFLSSTGTFSGLMYNIKKVDMNTADLMLAQNFDGLKHLGQVQMKDYLEYLRDWSDKNSRVKNSQFHVAISVRGREKTAEELLYISKRWMEKMGYKDVPTMYFFHRDTDNNHIHIVASRVNKDGKKINDSNEVRRGLRLIREVNGVDLSVKAKADFYRLEAYKVATRAQYVSLWTSQGYRAKMRDDILHLYKEGQKVLELGLPTIEKHIEKSVLGAERASDIRELFSRYKTGLSMDDFRTLLKEKHGIELVMYGRKDAPYGYAIVDHHKQSVYKGGDVLPLKSLLEGKRILSDKEQVERVNLFARYMLEEGRMTSQELSRITKTWGLSVYKGDISYRRAEIGRLSDDILNRLQYNDRLDKASRLAPGSIEALMAVARYYNIEPSDIIRKSEDVVSDRDLKSIYQDALNTDDFWDTMRQEEVALSSYGGKTYLMDLKYGAVEEIEIKARDYEYNHRVIQDLVEGNDIDSMLGLDTYDDIESSSTDNRLKKRRR